MSVHSTHVPPPRLSGDDHPDPGEPLKRPLTAVEERDLDALHFAWDDVFDLGYLGGRFLAYRIDAETPIEPLSGATTDELAAAILRDWGSR